MSAFNVEIFVQTQFFSICPSKFLIVFIGMQQISISPNDRRFLIHLVYYQKHLICSLLWSWINYLRRMLCLPLSSFIIFVIHHPPSSTSERHVFSFISLSTLKKNMNFMFVGNVNVFCSIVIFYKCYIIVKQYHKMIKFQLYICIYMATEQHNSG